MLKKKFQRLGDDPDEAAKALLAIKEKKPATPRKRQTAGAAGPSKTPTKRAKKTAPTTEAKTEPTTESEVTVADNETV